MIFTENSYQENYADAWLLGLEPKKEDLLGVSTLFLVYTSIH